MKNKLTVIGIVITTIILAGVAIFTALRLYQTRDTAVAPNVPSSKPKAQENLCSLSFTLVSVTSSPTSSATSTATSTSTSTATATSTSTSTSTSTATATATATANPQCNYACTSNSNCPSGLMCYIPSGSTTGNCRNTQCLTESDCSCAVVTNAPTTAPSTQPSLPVVGTTWPTILGTGFGILVIIGSLLLAL